MDEYQDLLENGEEELSSETLAMVEALEADEEFNQEIQDLLEDLEKGTLDLAAIQSKFLLLIKAALIRLNKGRSRALEHKLQSNEKDILEQLTMLSHHLMIQKVPLAKEASAVLNAPKDKYSSLTAASIQNTKQILKRFAVYEIYKVVNPRRIAGETKAQNFLHNYITGGIKKAMRYDLSEVKKASAQTIRTLEKKRKSFVKSGGMVR
jgi:hypothetical protein